MEMSDKAGTNGVSSRRKTHEVLAAQIREQIVTGALKEGQRLPPEDDLTAQYGVARNTLRESLRVLESQGLLTIRRGRGGGPEVTHPSLEPAATALAVSLQLQATTIGDLDEARRMLEPQIAGRLATAHTDADITALTAAIDVAHDAAEKNDPQAFGAAALGVHETLMDCSGSNTMRTISQVLHEVVDSFYSAAVRLPVVNQKMMRDAVKSYRKLVALIQAGDADAATIHWQAQMQFTIGGRDATELVRMRTEVD